MSRLVTTIDDCRAAVHEARTRGERIGFVPTMGALHGGHLSLVDVARERTDRIVMSIFVNPLQFAPEEDFERYPRDLEHDREVAAERGVDLMFAPRDEEMYPRPLATRVTMTGVTNRYEGAARPGHFDGVLTVVAKLFHIVGPDVAVFGQKDAQQAAAVQRMVADLDFPIEIVVAPIVRDDDGVALSSRNAYLSPLERGRARALSRSLEAARAHVAGGERGARRIVAVMLEVLRATPGVDVEYVEVVDPERFDPVEHVHRSALAVVAARVGGTRLIDNAFLDPDAG